MTQEPGLGLAYLTVAGATPLKHVEAAAAAGVDNVGLRLVAPLGLALPYEIIGNAPLVRAIKAACRDAGVRVYDVDRPVRRTLRHCGTAQYHRISHQTGGMVTPSMTGCAVARDRHPSSCGPSNGGRIDVGYRAFT